MQNAAKGAGSEARVRPALFILVKGGRPVGRSAEALFIVKVSFFTLRISEALLSAFLINGLSPMRSFCIFSWSD